MLQGIGGTGVLPDVSDRADSVSQWPITASTSTIAQKGKSKDIAVSNKYLNTGNLGDSNKLLNERLAILITHVDGDHFRWLINVVVTVSDRADQPWAVILIE